MIELVEIARDLQFPEGPVVMPDGTVVLVEIKRGTLDRVHADGTVEVVTELGGGPNGVAIGPDGAAYVCNNGGSFTWHEIVGLTIPGPPPPEHRGGSIQRVDLSSGVATTLYDACDGRPLRSPNDLVFDASGGFWFSDHGVRSERSSDRSGIFYAATDGSSVTEVVFPLDAPNGVGLSPAGDRLYAAETHTGRLWAWDLSGPGQLAAGSGRMGEQDGRTLVMGLPGMQLFDSLAVEEGGNVCVATLSNGGITVASPDGSSVEHLATGDPLTTNICFGGADRRTAYLTLSGTGRLVSTTWPRPGAALAY